jgi:hypothetical protein
VGQVRKRGLASPGGRADVATAKPAARWTMDVMAISLEDFDDLDGDWNTLFLGNGASINICTGFGYSSLHDEADLSAKATSLFAEFDTTNFERVLQLLDDARRVGGAIGTPTTGQRLIKTEYDGIREALFGVVNTTHIDHDEIPNKTLLAIAEALLNYEQVFTTNYDLLAYWSLMAYGKWEKTTDLFGRQGGSGPLTFDLTATGGYAGRTKVLYLHGGLHLWHDPYTDVTGKWEREDGGRLLDLEQRYRDHSDRQALFVSAGRSADKLRAIRRSDYLSFALRQLERNRSDMVIFGSSLDAQDRHIIDAMNVGRSRRIAISLRAGGRMRDLRKRKADLMALFHDRREVVFFDAVTHPLGQPDLNVR